ncbi:hypothetical protein D0466_08790 [Peribacillus glennii]|uniref:Uncharacterized protein n=1 Tax=Peribacillus glennii TaxID=2303991 RepID=A0A372LK13_9BACI|nr:hypothetical protein D0466_08790 [Peribacillus glennii]
MYRGTTLIGNKMKAEAHRSKFQNCAHFIRITAAYADASFDLLNKSPDADSRGEFTYGAP